MRHLECSHHTKPGLPHIAHITPHRSSPAQRASWAPLLFGNSSTAQSLFTLPVRRIVAIGESLQHVALSLTDAVYLQPREMGFVELLLRLFIRPPDRSAKFTLFGHCFRCARFTSPK